MLESERLPLQKVLKLLPPILKEYKLEGLLTENLKNLRTQIKEEDFPLMTNTLLLDIFQDSNLAKKPIIRTPVWLIKSSGRYLPEFLELRKSKAYFDVIIFKKNLLPFFF